MADNCENRQVLSKWMCRLGNSLELQEDGSYRLLSIIKNIEDLYDDVTLQDGALTTGDGTEVNVAHYNEIILSLFGINIATSTVVFEVNDADDNWTSVLGVKLGTSTSATSTSGIATGNNTPGEKWAIPIKGSTQFRARISAITGTNAALTVKGRMVR